MTEAAVNTLTQLNRITILMFSDLFGFEQVKSNNSFIYIPQCFEEMLRLICNYRTSSPLERTPEKRRKGLQKNKRRHIKPKEILTPMLYIHLVSKIDYTSFAAMNNILFPLEATPYLQPIGLGWVSIIFIYNS